MKTNQTDNVPGKQQVKRFPWWGSVICAIATYCTLKYVLPELAPANQTLQELFQLGPVAAPVLTIPFLLLAAKQLYDNDIQPEDPESKKRDDA